MMAHRDRGYSIRYRSGPHNDPQTILVDKMADTDGKFAPAEETRLNYDSKEAITDGIIDLLKPSVVEIDERVRTVR